MHNVVNSVHGYEETSHFSEDELGKVMILHLG
jgi:hypothetical protein